MPRFHKEHRGKHLLLKTKCVGKVHIQTSKCLRVDLCRLFLCLFFRVRMYIIMTIYEILLGNAQNVILILSMFVNI